MPILKSFFKTIQHFFKNQFYTLVAVWFGVQGLATIGYGGQAVALNAMAARTCLYETNGCCQGTFCKKVFFERKKTAATSNDGQSFSSIFVVLNLPMLSNLKK
jgi:hypothetical protein